MSFVFQITKFKKGKCLVLLFSLCCFTKLSEEAASDTTSSSSSDSPPVRNRSFMRSLFLSLPIRECEGVCYFPDHKGRCRLSFSCFLTKLKEEEILQTTPKINKVVTVQETTTLLALIDPLQHESLLKDKMSTNEASERTKTFSYTTDKPSFGFNTTVGER
ncbi:UNVERIFIED_CONTAM: hypothetical protein RMT77_001053 [Armadillidium vulgare]